MRLCRPRHWFTVYGFPGTRAPECQRGCGTPNPRPLSKEELEDYEWAVEVKRQYYAEASE